MDREKLCCRQISLRGSKSGDRAMMDLPFRKKYSFAFIGIIALTAVTFLITLDFMYSQSSGQINTGFNTYENDIHKVSIQYPSNWEQKDEHSNSIVRFIVPGTGGETKPTGVLISIFQMPND